jgi:hypothetical protein
MRLLNLLGGSVSRKSRDTMFNLPIFSEATDH